MTERMRVIVIGAGVGGLALVRRLSRFKKSIDITVIDPAPTHDFAPSFLWMLDGSRTAEGVSRPTRNIERYGATLVSETVTEVDKARKVVRTVGGEYAYDQLVLAPGAQLAPESIDGLVGAAHSFYRRNDAERLTNALHAFAGGRVLLTIPAMPYKCPAAPYEAAFLIEALLKKRGVQAQIDIHTVEPQPMPVAGPMLGGRVAGLLRKRGIGYHTQQQLQHIDPHRGVAVFESGDTPYDLLIAIPPHRVPDFVSASQLAGPAGWIPVDDRTMSVAGQTDVFAIGDVTSITLSNGKPLPKAGVFAHAQAHVVGDNLIAAATGKRPSATFNGHGACFLEIGNGKAGLARGNFYATPDPKVRMLPPTRLGHFGKVIFERRWLKQLRN